MQNLLTSPILQGDTALTVRAVMLFSAVPVAFITRGWIKFTAITLAVLAVTTTEVHAITIKEVKPAPAPEYMANNQKVGVAEAMDALLKGQHVYQCKEVELQASRTGVSIKPKKAN